MAQLAKSMKWIDEFAKGSFGLFAGNTIANFQPIDFYRFFPMWYDIWVGRIAKCIRALDLQNKSFKEIKHLLPTPSNMRAMLIKIIATYPAWREKKVKDTKLVTDFLARMLIECCPKDPFAISTNPFHNEDEVKKIISNISLSQSEIEDARLLGKLNTAAGSLVHGIYNDVVTDFAWDVYGPYVLEKDEEQYTMLIRHFPDLNPKELWPLEFLSRTKELVIYNLYQGVTWEISAVGCHTISKIGNPVEGMKLFAVYGDGKLLSETEIKNLVVELSEKAEKIYKKIRSMNFEELKEKVMLQVCYQLKKLFVEAAVDWKPTGEMIERIKDRPLPKGLLPNDIMMTSVKQYREVFNIQKFEDE